jgi:hypothetical protein
VRLDSVSVFRWNLLSWTQSLELVSISGHQHQSQSQSYIATDGQSVSQSVSLSACLGVELHLGLMTRYKFLFDSYCFVHMGRPL